MAGNDGKELGNGWLIVNDGGFFVLGLVAVVLVGPPLVVHLGEYHLVVNEFSDGVGLGVGQIGLRGKVGRVFFVLVSSECEGKLGVRGVRSNVGVEITIGV